MNNIEIPTFVKWAGGKIQLLEQFKKLYPKNINRYFEPMVGSGAVFFYVKQKFNPDYCMISDVNEDLINSYKIVQTKVDALIEILKNHKKNHNKKYFYDMRKEFNSTKNKLEKVALLIYLNKTCFNGLYRVNSYGEFNVPFGKYKNPAILQEKKLRKASEILQNVDIRKMNFSRIKSYVKKGDFIYFDPPYYPLSITSSFTRYHKDKFLEKEQKKLADVFQKLDKYGCLAMLSNSDVPLIHELYRKYEGEGHLFLVKAKRMINCDAKGRKAINEVVVTNYTPKNIQSTI